jgi:hypothetical protein
VISPKAASELAPAGRPSAAALAVQRSSRPATTSIFDLDLVHAVASGLEVRMADLIYLALGLAGFGLFALYVIAAGRA